MSTSTTHVPDVIPSHSTFKGDAMGAQAILPALIAFSQLVTQLASIASQWAVQLANIETSIQGELTTLQNNLYTPAVQNAIKDAEASKPKNSQSDTVIIQQYTTQLGVVQSQIQAATKGIDPTLTTTQNLPNALITALNTFIQQTATLLQGLSALSNNRIQ